jgi:hypothetical protein
VVVFWEVSLECIEHLDFALPCFLVVLPSLLFMGLVPALLLTRVLAPFLCIKRLSDILDERAEGPHAKPRVFKSP